MTKIRKRGRHDADAVETVVVVEPLILDRDDRLQQVRRYLVERHLDALLLVDGEHEPIACVVDGGRLRHFRDVPDGVFDRQTAAQVVVEEEQADEGADDEETKDAERRHERLRVPRGCGPPLGCELMQVLAQ